MKNRKSSKSDNLKPLHQSNIWEGLHPDLRVAIDLVHASCPTNKDKAGFIAGLLRGNDHSLNKMWSNALVDAAHWVREADQEAMKTKMLAHKQMMAESLAARHTCKNLEKDFTPGHTKLPYTSSGPIFVMKPDGEKLPWEE